MDACVSSPGSVHRYRPARHRRKRIFEQRLYRYTTALALPADVVRAVVLEREFEGTHGLQRARSGFDDGKSLRAEGTGFALVAGHVHLHEAEERHRNPSRIAAAIDE